jgi:hypothetical protein
MAQRLLIGDMVMRRAAEVQGQPKEAGFSPFANPTVAGALLGGAGGAGIGVLSSEDRSRDALLRAGLIGAGVGAAFGGSAGALSKGVESTRKGSEELAKMLEKARDEGVAIGHKAGWEKALEKARDLMKARGIV